MEKDGWEILRREEDGYFDLSLRYPHWKEFAVTFEIGPDEKLNRWHKTIGLGITGGGRTASQRAQDCAKRIRPVIAKVLPRGGTLTDSWMLFHHEFAQMDFEKVACLLYDRPSHELQRLASTLKRIALAVCKEVNEFEAVTAPAAKRGRRQSHLTKKAR
jgi:hypothetical protein